MSSQPYPYSERERLFLERYLDLLYAESSRRNVTRVPRAEAWARHVEESLDLVPLRDWSPGERVLDLGSGGGIPGIPLAIVQPALSIGLIERNQAKAAFLLTCLGQLDLPAVQVLARDALELARSADFAAADVLVSRAALPVLQLLRLAGRLLGEGGEGLVHVGVSVTVDASVEAAASRAGVGRLKLETAGRSHLLRFVRLPRG
ncbi:MAG TPA: RsmG family class I SAM-dependent methyltransferase [Candidatus Acidoferrales bacterium]|nr:RsmG family class I SAM-dependent methyltransferase [Candidatus Acidoferrales bacterium]